MRTSFICSTALCTVLATPLFADVTPADVWAQISSQAALDERVTITTDAQTTQNGTLNVEGITWNFTDPQSKVQMRIPMLSFKDNGDGTVGLSYPETIPMTFTMEIEGDTVEASFLITSKNVLQTVSGTPEKMNFEFTGDSMKLGNIEIVAEEPIAIDGGFEMVGFAGNSIWDGQGASGYSSDFSANAVLFDLTVKTDDGDPVEINMNGTMDGLAASATASITEDGPIAPSFGPYSAVNYMYDIGPGQFDISTMTDMGPFTMAGEWGALSTHADVTQNGLDTDFVYKDFAVNVAPSAMLPLPVSVSLAELGMSFAMPVAENTSSPVGMGLALKGLEINEDIWSLFDPTGLLPRDPATLDIQVDGVAQLFIDIFDPSKTAEMKEVPGQIEAVNVKTLTLDALGVKANGAGEFTFDNADMMTIPGMPRPEGSFAIEASGINGLIDNLIKLGVMSEEDAMGARMAMSFFATAGAGEDTVSTTLEATKDGQVLLNGQRIK
ncbi:MAG: DUF2125 domain-containing protein [Planktomarina sp.]